MPSREPSATPTRAKRNEQHRRAERQQHEAPVDVDVYGRVYVGTGRGIVYGEPK